MCKVSLLAAIAALSLAGGTAVAQTADGKPVNAPKEKKICKGDVNSNSRIAKTRVCRTAAEWAEQSNQNASENEDRVRQMGRSN